MDNKKKLNIESDSIVPNIAEFTRATVREIEEVAPNVSTDEMWASLGKYTAWSRALKPYLIERIEQLKTMSEIDFNGKESVDEIGIRYLICGGIAKELQDIITKVETTKLVMEQLKKKKQNDKI